MSDLYQATAPYNFIPYDLKKIAGPSDSDELFSGSIECSLKTLTPLMVAAGNPDRNEGTDVVHQFNMHNNLPCIPGTSVKGMLRSLIEILSFSQMSAVSTSKIFWREPAADERDDSRHAYKEYLGHVFGGFLFKEGADYKIVSTGFEAIPKPAEGSNPDDDLDNGKYIIKEYSVSDVLVKTGHMQKKAHDYRFTMKGTEKTYIVPDVVMDDFLSPHQMIKGGYQEKIWKRMQKRLSDKTGVPIFYTASDKSGKQITAIGLSKYFRVKYDTTPYERSLSGKSHDFANNLFGYIPKKGEDDLGLKGKVRVDPILFQSGHYTSMSPVKVILMEPHPSCLSHYIVQKHPEEFTNSKYQGKVNPKSLRGYWRDEVPELSGRKYYWHRDYCPSEIQGNGNEKTMTTISPIENADAVFRIHVDKVTKEELGAILMALDLPEGHAHKLGMGKPLGLGSVRLDIQKIDVLPITEMYGLLQSRLVHEKNANLDNGFIKECKDEFSQFIRTQIKAQDAYEDLNEIKTLRKMMDLKHKPSNSATKTMTLEQFKYKWILKPALMI